MKTFPVRVIKDYEEDLGKSISEMTNYCFQHQLSLLNYRIEADAEVVIIFEFIDENDAMIFKLRF